MKSDGKAADIALDGLDEHTGRHAVEGCEILIEQDLCPRKTRIDCVICSTETTSVCFGFSTGFALPIAIPF